MPHQKEWKPSGQRVNVPIPSLGGILHLSLFSKGGDCIIKSTIPSHRISCLLVPFLTWLKTQIMLNKGWSFLVILCCSYLLHLCKAFALHIISKALPVFASGHLLKPLTINISVSHTTFSKDPQVHYLYISPSVLWPPSNRSICFVMSYPKTEGQYHCDNENIAMCHTKSMFAKRNINEAVIMALKNRISIASLIESKTTALFWNKLLQITITFIQ